MKAGAQTSGRGYRQACGQTGGQAGGLAGWQAGGQTGGQTVERAGLKGSGQL